MKRAAFDNLSVKGILVTVMGAPSPSRPSIPGQVVT